MKSGRSIVVSTGKAAIMFSWVGGAAGTWGDGMSRGVREGLDVGRRTGGVVRWEAVT